METNNLLAPLFFVLIRLMGGAILKFGLKKMPLPYTVGLFAFGLLIGTFDRIGWLESIPMQKVLYFNNLFYINDLYMYMCLLRDKLGTKIGVKNAKKNKYRH